jgi:glycosyltransferase involved in cell wall biosynthesis
MSRVRVASVIPDLWFGGSSNRLLSFATSVDRARFEHVVVTLWSRDPTQEQTIGSRRTAYAEAGVEVIDLGEPPRRRIMPSRRPDAVLRAGVTLGRMLGRLCRVLRERRIDLVDAQHATATLMGAMAGRLTGRAVTITEYYPYYFDRSAMRTAGNLAYRSADAFICDSQAHSDLINRWLWRPHPRSVVIPNGIPVPSVTRSNSEMREALKIPLDRGARIVGQVSRLVRHKGQRDLLRAARCVLAEFPDTWFVLTGYAGEDPPFLEQLRADARELGIEDRLRIVSWPGSIGDIWELIDIHVHASVEDSLPIAITEGMAFGKPAVVTDVGGVREMVTHEETGLVVPMRDPDAIATGVLRLLREPETARRLGAGAKARYQRGYRPEVMARAIEKVFLDVLERRRPRA